MFVKELVRKVLGVVLGFLLSCVLTFIIINAYSFNLGIESLLTFLGIAAVARAIMRTRIMVHHSLPYL